MRLGMLVLALVSAISQVECFSMVGSGLAVRHLSWRGGLKGARPRGSSVAGLALRMQGKGTEEKEEDPYVVKEEKPSFAKEENQWELDNAAGETAADKSKKIIAITTGALAMVVSVVYLFAVLALESRGDMKPAPPEAYGAFDFDQASAILVAMSNL